MSLNNWHNTLLLPFQATISSLIKWGILTILSFCIAIYSAYLAPNDYLQGVYYKIMYVHVPSAWISMGLYVFMAGLSCLFIIYKTPFLPLIAESTCVVGAVFTFITLITGSIWGMPTWGTWWIWDARLTSMLILLFIYISCIALRTSFKSNFGSLITAYFSVFGLINIPIIKFSVDVWNTLHQPSSFIKLSAPTVHSSMIPPLLIMLISMLGVAWISIILLIKSKQMEAKYNRWSRSLVISLFIIHITSHSYGSAWNKKHKEGYSLTQYLSPSKYTSKSSYSSLSSISSSYKTYIEYGMTSNWMIILELEKTDIHDVIKIDTMNPYKASYSHYGPYYKHNGALMLSYQIARDDLKALSAQIGYRSGDYVYSGKGKYNPQYEEMLLGISQGISSPISSKSNSYIEFRYTPSFYHKIKVYSPETGLNLGLNFNNKINIEIGLLHKMNKAYIKDSPHKVSERDFPHHFEYLAKDVNPLLSFKSHKDVITTHLKLSYQLNKKHGIELSVFNSSNSANEKNLIYSIGYILKW